MNQRPTPSQMFKHQDGGFYRYLGMTRHTEDQAAHVLYEHVWPFDTAGDPWVRPATEWDSRFTPVTPEQLATAMQQDRTAMQEAIKQAKAARRAREAANKPA